MVIRPAFAVVATLIAMVDLGGRRVANRLGPATPATLATPAQVAEAAQWPGAMHDAAHSGATNARGPSSGRLRWTRRLEGVVTPGPAVAADETIYAASNAGILHAIDLRSGKDRWSFDAQQSYGNDLSTTPVVLPDGRIVWPGPGNQLYLLTPEGRVVSTTRLDGFVLSPAFDSARSILYAQDMSGRLWSFAVTPKALRKRWTLDLGGVSYASPAIAPDGSVRSAAGNDLVAIVDHVNRGAVRWRFPTGT